MRVDESCGPVLPCSWHDAWSAGMWCCPSWPSACDIEDCIAFESHVIWQTSSATGALTTASATTSARSRFVIESSIAAASTKAAVVKTRRSSRHVENGADEFAGPRRAGQVQRYRPLIRLDVDGEAQKPTAQALRVHDLSDVVDYSGIGREAKLETVGQFAPFSRALNESRQQ